MNVCFGKKFFLFFEKCFSKAYNTQKRCVFFCHRKTFFLVFLIIHLFFQCTYDLGQQVFYETVFCVGGNPLNHDQPTCT